MADIVQRLPLQAALFLQDFTSFDLSDQSRSINGTSSGINTVFQILLQPEPGTGFEWVWTQMDDAVLGGLDQSQLYSINGSVPCCIPVSPELEDAIAADNTLGSAYYKAPADSWRDHVRDVEGQILGQCSLTNQTATLSWYANTYVLNASTGALDALLLGVNFTSATLSNAPPVASKGEFSSLIWLIARTKSLRASFSVC